MPIRSLFVCAALLLAPLAQAENCANATDQSSMDECSSNSFKAADTELNAVYKQINQRLQDNADGKQLLVTAQRSWLAFRDSECKFTASGVTGGSAYPMIYANCLAGLTTTRTKDLKEYLKCEEGDLSCPVPWQ